MRSLFMRNGGWIALYCFFLRKSRAYDTRAWLKAIPSLMKKYPRCPATLEPDSQHEIRRYIDHLPATHLPRSISIISNRNMTSWCAKIPAFFSTSEPSGCHVLRVLLSSWCNDKCKNYHHKNQISAAYLCHANRHILCDKIPNRARLGTHHIFSFLRLEL